MHQSFGNICQNILKKKTLYLPFASSSQFQLAIIYFKRSGFYEYAQRLLSPNEAVAPLYRMSGYQP